MDKTPGGLLLPQTNDHRLLKDAPWPPHCHEPIPAPHSLKIDAGYLSPYFITKPDHSTAELNAPLVLLTERTIAGQQELIPILEKAAQAQRPLLIVAPAIEDPALALMVLNKLRGILRVCAIAPKDIAAIARHLECQIARAPLESLAIDELAAPKSVIVGIRSTVIA